MEDNASHIAAIRARLAKISESTMLLAPRASAVLYALEAQLEEVIQNGLVFVQTVNFVYQQLQTIVHNMADNPVELLLDRDGNEWDYDNKEVLHYALKALERSSPHSRYSASLNN
eukprot:723829-Amorphochlora_amoeboformis.AAC.1